MGQSTILKIISLMVFPFVIMFGIIIIVNGDLSPGGGFQGGVIIATGLLLLSFVGVGKIDQVHKIITIEKFLFLFLISVSTLSVITRGEFFTNFITHDYPLEVRRIYLILLNSIIGAKVTLGLYALILIYMKDGGSYDV